MTKEKLRKKNGKSKGNNHARRTQQRDHNSGLNPEEKLSNTKGENDFSCEAKREKKKVTVLKEKKTAQTARQAKKGGYCKTKGVLRDKVVTRDTMHCGEKAGAEN